MGAKVRAYDPVAMEQAEQVLTDVTYCRGPYDCVEGADATVIDRPISFGHLEMNIAGT